MNVTIPEAATATKNMRGELKASQYVYLNDVETEEGKACLYVSTGKGNRGVATTYSFGHHKNENGMSCFSCMIMSDYSKRLQHEAKRATAKAINEAHKTALLPANINLHILAAAEQHDIELS